MRRVRISRTFAAQLVELLDLGAQIYGERLIAEKRALVFSTIGDRIALFPGLKQRNAELGLVAYSVSGTPFVILYDFDDEEVRVHFIVHRHASLDELNADAIEW